MKIIATLAGSVATIASDDQGITTDITIVSAASLATHLSEFSDAPTADERIAATYNIVPNDTGLRIINTDGAFDLPWRHIASAVAQLNA